VSYSYAHAITPHSLQYLQSHATEYMQPARCYGSHAVLKVRHFGGFQILLAVVCSSRKKGANVHQESLM
jgi:hypothetical protein